MFGWMLLTNYISALNYPNIDDKLYKSYWPADVHMIGKDILKVSCCILASFY